LLEKGDIRVKNNHRISFKLVASYNIWKYKRLVKIYVVLTAATVLNSVIHIHNLFPQCTVNTFVGLGCLAGDVSQTFTPERLVFLVFLPLLTGDCWNVQSTKLGHMHINKCPQRISKVQTCFLLFLLYEENCNLHWYKQDRPTISINYWFSSSSLNKQHEEANMARR
jgi:hypothetical protein